MTEKLMKVPEVSEFFGVKPARIYELCREKQLPFILIGQRQYRFSKAALEKWIENGGNQTNEVNEDEN